MAGIIRVPQISQADMAAFHEAHFSQLATDHFQTQFLRPEHPPAENTTHNAVDDEEYYEEEDDGLGYYPDGVKRTLTDEQIAIFRHSELEALCRVRESSKIRKETTTTNSKEDAAHDLSEGEVSSPTPSAAAKKSKKRKRGKNKNKNKNIHMGEPIDLRKRTWDVVDKGLATLDYDEENNESVETSAIQRRRISYDD